MPQPTIRTPWEQLFTSLRKLRTAWPARGWSWDSRLGCISSSFGSEFEDQARSAASEAFPNAWTPSTVSKASTTLRDVVEKSGGLRSGQLLLSGRPVGRVTPYGLWWPWQTGLMISLRVGLTLVDWNEEPFPELRDLFAVTM